MKKITILLFACMLLLLCACTVKYADVLRANWGLMLPENAGLALVYEKDSGESFHGDGVRFHVYTCESTAPVDALAAWQSEISSALFSDRADCAAAQWLDEIDAAQAYRPAYSGGLRYAVQAKNDDMLVLIWDRANMTLYVLEQFI
ncbi:MAG: hypothetical protein IIZ49_00625 [Oscillospiraceae bacterium]|nr:hypothetical protein [Oscillospiraceae bacterium]